MIDQHAAHERILFEEFFEKYSCGKIISQNLIADEHLILDDTEKEILKDNMELIEGFGFKLSENGGEYNLKSVPYIFDKPATAEYLRDIIDTVKSENIKNLYDRRLLNIATIACKAAVKGGDRLTFEEAEELIKKLLTLKNPFSCPHGRPTIIEMTEYELEKKFKRIQ